MKNTFMKNPTAELIEKSYSSYLEEGDAEILEQFYN